jgi:hypothetical protein
LPSFTRIIYFDIQENNIISNNEILDVEGNSQVFGDDPNKRYFITDDTGKILVRFLLKRSIGTLKDINGCSFRIKIKSDSLELIYS